MMRIRFKYMDNEFEAEGDEAFVAAWFEKFAHAAHLPLAKNSEEVPSPELQRETASQ
jgi:hypothetical protein